MRISIPGRPAQTFPSGYVLNPSAAPDPAGPIVVTYDDGREERFAAGTTFTPVPGTPPTTTSTTAAAPAVNQKGVVEAGVESEGNLKVRHTTREAEWAKRIIVLLLVVATALGMYAYLRGGNASSVTPAAPPTPPAPVTQTLPDCSAEFAKCMGLAQLFPLDAAEQDKACRAAATPPNCK